MSSPPLDLSYYGRARRAALTAGRRQGILAKALVAEQIEGRPRAVVLAAMRAAAEKRIAGVIRKGRRRHYDHAASLVSMCAELDPTSGTWVKRLRAKYSRYPALLREFDRRLAQT